MNRVMRLNLAGVNLGTAGPAQSVLVAEVRGLCDRLDAPRLDRDQSEAGVWTDALFIVFP